MLTTEQIMLSIGARDNASNTAEAISRNFLNMGNDVSRSLSSIQQGFANIGQVTEGMMTSLTGKNAMDTIFGTASKAETNKVLLKNMLDDVEKNYDSFYETVDKTTDKSLTSMQELIPALNVLNSATGATDEELKNITDDVANFGASVLAQTGSVDLAQQAMMDLAKGYKGQFASLDQYGISEDALKSKGWEEGDSLEEYMKAVTEIVGSTEELMQTNQGLDALIGKSFSRAGKKIGNEFLPIIKDVKRGFIDLDNEMGGAIASGILLGEAGVEVATSWSWNLSTILQGFRDISDGLRYITGRAKQVEETAENAGNALNAISNASDLGSGAGALGGAGQVAGDVSKAEKGIDSGSDALMTADIIADLKSQQKDVDKARKEATATLKDVDRLQEDLDALQMGIGESVMFMGTPSTKPTNVGKIEEETNQLWSYYENLFDGQERAMSNAEKVSAKLGMSKSGGNVLDELIEANKDDRQRAGKLLGELDDLKRAEDEIQWGMDYTQSGFFDKLRMRKDKGIQGNASDLFSGLKNFFKGTDEVADIVDDVGDTAKALDAVDAVADGAEALATGAGAIGATAPEMAVASAEVEATAVASTSLAGAFTSMIVPALAIAGVIAIMIPIIAGIAVEALFFLSLVKQFFDSLDFGSVDMKKNIDGIKQLAEGLAWVGVAMLALTAVNIATQLAMVTSFFTGLTTPLGLAVDSLKKVAEQLQGFNAVSIGEDVVPNLQRISEGLGAVGNAMLALTKVSIAEGIDNFVNYIFGFKDSVSALEQGKADLVASAGVLNSIATDMPTIDTGVAEKMKATCDAIASVADAIGALRDLRNGENFDILGGLGDLFGGVDIGQAFIDAKWELIDAGNALQSYTDIPDVPEGIGEKVQKLGDAISKVSEAIGTLRKLRDDSNWDAMWGSDSSEITDAIKNSVSYLNTASSELGNLQIGDSITEDLVSKMDIVKNAMTKVSEVMSTVSNMPVIEEGSTEQIHNAVEAVKNSATELAGIDSTLLSEDPSGVLGTIQSALQSLRDTLASASGFSSSAQNIGAQIVSGVQSGLSPLSSTVITAVANALNSAKATANTYGKGVGGQATSGFQSALKIADATKTEMDYAVSAMNDRYQDFYNAGASLGSAMSAGFESTKGLNTGSPGNLARTIAKEMDYGLGFIKDMVSPFFNSSAELGRSLSTGFGNPDLNVSGLNASASSVPYGSSGDTTIIISEGAVQVDARNKTEKEAKQMFISVFESLKPSEV